MLEKFFGIKRENPYQQIVSQLLEIPGEILPDWAFRPEPPLETHYLFGGYMRPLGGKSKEINRETLNFPRAYIVFNSDGKPYECVFLDENSQSKLIFTWGPQGHESVAASFSSDVGGFGFMVEPSCYPTPRRECLASMFYSRPHVGSIETVWWDNKPQLLNFWFSPSIDYHLLFKYKHDARGRLSPYWWSDNDKKDYCRELSASQVLGLEEVPQEVLVTPKGIVYSFIYQQLEHEVKLPSFPWQGLNSTLRDVLSGDKPLNEILLGMSIRTIQDFGDDFT